jgi:hypothetical protein
MQAPTSFFCDSNPSVSLFCASKMTENEPKTIIICTFLSFFLHNLKKIRNFAAESCKGNKNRRKNYGTTNRRNTDFV